MSSARQREKVQALGHRTHGRIAKASSSWRMSRALQRRHSPANEQQPFDKDSLVCFAVAAAASIRRECNILTKLPRLSPFLAILASLLSEVEERLGGETPPAEARVLKLLAILEWVAKVSKFQQSRANRTIVHINTNSVVAGPIRSAD